MPNIAENISKLPEAQEKVNKLVDQYKNLTRKNKKLLIENLSHILQKKS
ncbi:hypothetical protein RAMDARK_1835 [Rickettsia amblyommatis str. Darkwater]|nr:hypothetical protein RAMDARK_1835 [Rickettsia amblyommatis str. Darkwater]